MALQTSHAFSLGDGGADSETVRRTRRWSGVERAPGFPISQTLPAAGSSPRKQTDSNYWAKHLRQTVRFADGIAELFKEPAHVLLEVGPGQTLSKPGKTTSCEGCETASVFHRYDTRKNQRRIWRYC